MNLHTASSAVMRNEAERERDKRQGVGEGKGARGLAVAVAWRSVRGQLSFCVGVQNIFIWALCADARSVFQAGPPRGPSVQRRSPKQPADRRSRQNNRTEPRWRAALHYCAQTSHRASEAAGNQTQRQQNISGGYTGPLQRERNTTRPRFCCSPTACA